VASATNPAANHIVTVDYHRDGTLHAHCTCPWALNGGVGCSHVMAALEALAGKRGRRLSFWQSREEALRQKRRVFCLVDYKKRGDGIWITSRAA
jgi:uncharacterized Zn finger protein